MSGYLCLNAFENNRIIVYRNDCNGNPILNPNDILIINIKRIVKGGKGIQKQVKLNFNGDNYKIIRETLLEKGGRKEDLELKKIVQKKLSRLEGRI